MGGTVGVIRYCGWKGGWMGPTFAVASPLRDLPPILSSVIGDGSSLS